MPSSLLFAGLVATWLAVFVPMAARRRQPMRRPSEVALSARVLARPSRHRRRIEEVSGITTDTAEPTPRFRPGRGGYDPEAAALAAAARCAFRQRVVLLLALLAVTTALVAAVLAMPRAWWVHGGVDLLLVAYLANLRRQVRTERAIRARRAARQAGGRRRPAADGEVAAAAPDPAAAEDPEPDAADPDPPGDADAPDSGETPTTPDTASTEPPAPEETPALPRLPPVPLPPRPAGTELLELDDEDPELHELDHQHRRGYRRAAGQ